MLNITPLVQAILGLLAAAITVYLIPFIRSKTTEQQRDAIAKWVRIAVEAAEQIYTGAKRGDERKEYVIDFLAARGIKLDADAVDAMIEAAVLQLKKI